MAAKVKVDVTADGTGFHRVMSGVEKRLEGLKKFSGIGFKESLLGLAGGVTITAMADNMISFAKSIEQASENMGVTIEKVQRLRVVAREAGVELGFFGGVFNKLNLSAAKALGGDNKLMATFSRLGVSQTDLKNLNNFDLLKKVVGGTEGMTQAAGSTLLGQVAGKKAGSVLFAQREGIMSNEKGPSIDEQNIRKLAELHMEIENLVDVIRSKAIPIFTDLVTAIEKITNKTLGETEITKAGLDAAAEAGTKEGKKPGILKKAGVAALWGMAQIGSWVAAPFQSSEARAASLERIDNRALEMLYGKNAVAAFDKGISGKETQVRAQDKALADRMAARRKEFDDRQKSFEGPANREALPFEEKELLKGTLKGGSQFLKFGDISGINAQYRMERLSQEANRLLNQIVINTSAEDFGQQGILDPFQQ